MVDASNDDNSVNEIIGAGAINCGNMKNTPCCKKGLHWPPLPKKI
jgi:hypothetical protein